MAENSLSTKLLQGLELPSEAKNCLLKGLEPKFRTCMWGYSSSIEEALAIGLVQTTALAYTLQDERLKRAYESLGLKGEELPNGQGIFAEDMGNACFQPCNSAYQTISSLGDLPVEHLLKQVAETYKLRIRRYTLISKQQLDSDQFLSSSDKYLTLYLFVHERKAAVLLPEKYFLGIQASDQGLQRAVFVSERQVEPPKVDNSLYEELKVSSELLSLVQEFAKPLLRYTDKLMQKYHSERDSLALAGGELATAKESMQRVIEDLEGADFGDGGEAPLSSLKAQLSKREDFVVCESCTQVASDLTLDCGHSVCGECVRRRLPEDWLNVKGELKVQIDCPVPRCSGQVSIEKIKQVHEELFKDKLKETEERWRLRLCPECLEMHTIIAYQELKCHHQVCKFCIGTKYSIDYMCPVCREGAYQQDLIPDTLKSTCNNCNGEFFYKHTCDYCCVTSLGRDFYAEHSELCNACLYTSYKQKKCICHENPQDMTPENSDLLGQKLKIRTDCHGQQLVPAKELINQTSCAHAICKDCLEHQLTGLACPICHIPFNPEAYSWLQMCCVCGNPMSDIKLTCGHHIHSACVAALIQAGKGNNHAKCHTCKKYIPPTTILPKIANQKELFAAFNNAFGYSFDFKCAKPGGRTKPLPLSDKKTFWFSCDCHKQSVCPYCQAPGNTGETGHACPYISLREQVDAMLAMGQEVMQCPFCQLPEEMTVEEYHQCTRCNRWFLSCCSASGEEFWFHGASFHRPNCSKFDPRGPTPENGPCQACIRNNRQCQRPVALQRPRLIGPGEAFPS